MYRVEGTPCRVGGTPCRVGVLCVELGVLHVELKTGVLSVYDVVYTVEECIEVVPDEVCVAWAFIYHAVLETLWSFRILRDPACVTFPPLLFPPSPPPLLSC